MPHTKLTEKQEAFARKYLETGNASEAYRHAYNTKTRRENTINCESSKLLNNPNITQRLDELKAEAAKRHDVTVDNLCDMYLKTYEAAKNAEQFSACNQATAGLSRLYGLDQPAKHKHEHQGKINVTHAPASERLARALGAMALGHDGG